MDKQKELYYLVREHRLLLEQKMLIYDLQRMNWNRLVWTLSALLFGIAFGVIGGSL
jgi:hypothetical protein